MRISRTEQTPQQKALETYLAAKRRKEKAEEEYEAHRQVLISIMRSEGVKTVTMEHEGKVAKGTLATQTRHNWDHEGLRKALGAKAFTTITTPKVDAKKMTEALNAGTVDRNIVAQYDDMKITYYVRTSEKAKKDG